MWYVIAVVGAFLVGDALRRVTGGVPVKALTSQIFIGLCALYVLGFRKKLYLGTEGVVRETKSWFLNNRDVLPWSEIRHVTLAFRRDKMLALFERDLTGWKLLFPRSVEGELRETLREFIPEVEVSTLGN